MISVLTVNYNTEKEIKRSIESVLQQRGIEFELYVIDNGSQDNSADVLKNYEGHIHLTLSKENLGFGKANNLLFQKVTTPYLYLMNPDAWLERDDTLLQLVNFLKQHPDHGMVGTTMLDIENRSTFPNSSYPGERHLRHPLPDLPGEIAWILGANMAMPSELFRTLSGFDEQFFLYGEDTDLCFRLRKAGYAIGVLPEVTIRHIGGASEKYHTCYEKELKKCDGRYRFYQKHYHPEDSRRLIHRDYRRAQFRAWNYQLAFRLTRQTRFRYKQQHYRAIDDAARVLCSRSL